MISFLVPENIAAQPRLDFSCAKSFIGVQKENIKTLFLFLHLKIIFSVYILKYILYIN